MVSDGAMRILNVSLRYLESLSTKAAKGTRPSRPSGTMSNSSPFNSFAMGPITVSYNSRKEFLWLCGDFNISWQVSLSSGDSSLGTSRRKRSSDSNADVSWQESSSCSNRSGLNASIERSSQKTRAANSFSLKAAFFKHFKQQGQGSFPNL